MDVSANPFGLPFLVVAAWFATAVFATGLRAVLNPDRAGTGLPPKVARRVGVVFLLAGPLLFALAWLLSSGAFGAMRQAENF